MPRRGSRSSRSGSRGGGLFSRQKSTTTSKSNSSRKPPPPAQRSAPPPPSQQQSTGGGIGSMIMQGMVWGAASSVGHRAVDAVMGPRSVNVEHKHTGEEKGTPAVPQQQQQQPASSQFNCNSEMTDFNNCVSSNQGDIGKCQYYFNLLNQCNQTSKDNNKQWN